MQRWKMAGAEPSLDELLDDEVMVPVMRSAGLSAEDIRTLVVETAERLADERSAPDSQSGAGSRASDSGHRHVVASAYRLPDTPTSRRADVAMSNAGSRPPECGEAERKSAA